MAATKRIPTDIFLELAGPELSRATGIAATFRGALRNPWLGPALCMAHGPEALRALDLIGVFRIVCDARLRGDHKEVAAGVLAIARHEVWGVTVDATDSDAVQAAAESALLAYESGECSSPPRLIGSLDPLPTNDKAWREARHCVETYESHVLAAVDRCDKAGFYGIRCRQSEADLVAPLESFVRAEAGIKPFAVTKHRGGRQLDTPIDLLGKGVSHPMLDPMRANCHDRTSADLLYNAIRRHQEENAVKTLLPPAWEMQNEEF